jgi:hypothetical protein
MATGSKILVISDAKTRLISSAVISLPKREDEINCVSLADVVTPKLKFLQGFRSQRHQVFVL